MAREAKSGKKGSEECLSVACKGKSGSFMEVARGEKR